MIPSFEFDSTNEPGHITDTASGRSGACTVISVERQTLKLRSAIDFPLSVCVKVEQGNLMWMGEVWACEPAATEFEIEIEATMVVKDVDGLDRLASHFRHERPRRTPSHTYDDRAYDDRAHE